MSLPIVSLPQSVPPLPQRPTQDDVPATRAERDEILAQARTFLRQHKLVPPMPMGELRTQAGTFCETYEIDPRYLEFCALILSNELWREDLATIPYNRRLLLLPKCLRVEDKCPAPFDEFGLLCKKCGLCTIQDLQEEAERLGYAVLVAEGSPIVMAIIETGKIEAIVGVSCLSVLRKVYGYMEAAAIPGVALPLLQDDCVDTSVDLEWVWDSVHLTSDDKTRRLDLVGLREEVDGWFTAEGLANLLGAPDSDVERLGHRWLARGGKRWRPFLTVATHQALSVEPGGSIPEDLRHVALAVECFHKASLVHDDIEDGDDQRYAEATLHNSHGVPIALNVGDYLLGEGYRLLAESAASPECRGEMMRIAAQGHRTLSVGQGEELAWQRDRRPLKPVEVVDIFRRKTAPAFETALRLGAVYGNAPDDLHEAIAAYSQALGIAYQIRDDLEDLKDAAAQGAPPEARPTILWALAHQAAKGERKAAVEAAWCGPDEDLSAEAAHELIREAGAESRAQELLDAYKDEAVRTLRRVQNANVKGLLRRTVGKIFNDLEIQGWCNEFEARNAPSVAPRAQAVG